MDRLGAAPPVPRRVVVTGGAGFVGSWICERLLEQGAEVVCVDNFATGSPANLAGFAEHPGLTVLEQDVCAGAHVEGEVDWVLHLASPASPVHYLRMPIETMKAGSIGTMHALELAERTGARFLLASTSEVYGDPLRHPQPETYWGNVNPVGPRSVYDEAKRFAEALTEAFRTARGVDTTIVRIFNTYGPRMQANDGRAVPAFMCQALEGEPLTVAGDGGQTRSLCYVEDTVAGILALAASDEPGPVNIGSADEMSMLELASCIRDLAGSSSPIRFVDLPADDPQLRRPDTSRAEQLLGWRPEVPLDVGLKRTLQWFAGQRVAPRPPARPGSRSS
jgi:dTDP-glucose 4,6-dehydratase